MKISDKHKKAIDYVIPKKDQQSFVDDAIATALSKQPKLKTSGNDVIELYVDGGSRGNPGPAGGGYAFYRAGQLIEKGSEFYGHQTNNRSEYLALRSALREAAEHFPDSEIRCFMDSQLVVKQLWGDYKVKSDNVKSLHAEVSRLADQFENFSIEHIPREQNKMADKMANEAMDAGV